MTTVNKFCCLCPDDWRGKRPEVTHAYFVGNGQWRGICNHHALHMEKDGVWTTPIAALLKGAQVKLEK